MAAASSKIPIIDFSLAGLEPGANLWFSTCQQVCNALEEHGCFEAIYSHDKFPPNLRKQIFDVAKELYDLPLETKKKTCTDKPTRGYLAVSQIHEGIGIYNADTLQGVQNFTTLMWPDGNHQFSENVYNVANVIKELDQKVVRMVCEYYGSEKHYDSLVKKTTYDLRFSKYKTCKVIENNLGLRSHTDKTFATILHENDVNGLELLTKDGDWVLFVPSSTSSFLYLAGEAFKVWSNGRMRPTPHRVMANGYKERYSVGLFMYNEGVICVPDELVNHKNPLQYKPLDHPGFLEQVVYHAVQKIEYSIEAYCGI